MREFALAHLARGERIVPSVSTIRIIRTIHIGNRTSTTCIGSDGIVFYSFGLRLPPSVLHRTISL